MPDIIDKLNDLLKQATTERSHYYVGSVVVESIQEITRLRAEVELWQDRHDSLLADAQRMECAFDEAWRQER